MSELPSAEEVRQLPVGITEIVGDNYIDINGHMNVRHYFDLHLRGMDVSSLVTGFKSKYLQERGYGSFSAEHNIRYFAEVLAGEQVSTHMRFLDRSDKTIHAMSLLVNDSKNQVANILEVLLVHIDMTTRRAAPMEPHIAKNIDAAIAAGNSLDWAAPINGAIKIRRR